MDDGECAVVCCVVCCEACADSDCSCLPVRAFCALAGLSALALAAVLVAAFAFVVPVRVSVDSAALDRLALLTNGTDASASFSYDISLGVALRNPNWAMSAWRAGPLDAELRFRGIPLFRAGLAGADWDRIRPRWREVYRVSVEGESATVALGSDAAAEFAKERAAGGVFELELVVAGEAKYEAHPHRRRFRASCPLKLALSTAAFARVNCAQ